jgi:hypothetical protein
MTAFFVSQSGSHLLGFIGLDFLSLLYMTGKEDFI